MGRRSRPTRRKRHAIHERAIERRQRKIPAVDDGFPELDVFDDRLWFDWWSCPCCSHLTEPVPEDEWRAELAEYLASEAT